ncbi:MAG: right-handed parallel beta-helix repeat-containing protein, partial [Candidatus Hydrogenedentales bacterium]
AFEFMEEPGEWYFDRPAKTLYYVPRDGEDMTRAEAVVPVLETLVTLEGTPGAPVENMRFEGITFAEATWLTPNRIGHADVQANFTSAPTAIFERDGWVVNLHNEYTKSPANVRLVAAHNVRFERCMFTRLGGAGLDIELGSQGNSVVGCVFQDISGSGVQIGDVQKQDHHPDDPRMTVKGNRVENCLFRNIGAEYEDSIGVFAGYTQETVVAHNEFADLPYSAISIGWGWGEQDSGGGSYAIPFVYEAPTPAKDNRIEFNHIHNVMLSRDDGGAVYTLGNQPGSIIRGNHIHDCVNNPGGIYLDEGSGFIEITGNLVYGVKTPMNYNNRNQDRIKTCNEHDNLFDADPNAEASQAIVKAAGIEEAYRDLPR